MGIVPFERLVERHYIKEDILQSRMAIYIAIFFCLVFSFGDYLNFGFSTNYFLTVSFRIAFLAFSIRLLLIFKHTKHAKKHIQIMLLWGSFFVALVLYVNILRPADNLNFIYIDIVTALALYLVMPNNVYHKVMLAGILTVGDTAIITFLKEPVNYLSLTTIFIAFVVANILGIVYSNRLFRFRQTQYRALLQEQNNRKELEKIAYLDYLTGAYNRRKFFELGELEFSRFKRYGSPFSLIMLDLDYFKRLNDKYGHEAGDLFLTEFANIIIGHKRTVDIIGRLGGEEFALILPETSLEYAKQAANRVLSHCADIKVPYYNQWLYTTVSIGITEAMARDQSFADTMKRADNALYKAKRGGRNRIVQQ